MSSHLFQILRLRKTLSGQLANPDAALIKRLSEDLTNAELKISGLNGHLMKIFSGMNIWSRKKKFIRVIYSVMLVGIGFVIRFIIIQNFLWYEIQYDIMRHHNFAREKQNLFEEMEYHAKVIPKVTKQIGRPKLDTSKIEKLWIEDYNLESLEPVDPLITY